MCVLFQNDDRMQPRQGSRLVRHLPVREAASVPSRHGKIISLTHNKSREFKVSKEEV